MIELIDAIVKDTLNEVHTSLPAVIQDIDYVNGTCSVEIIPKRELCGQIIKYPPLIDVRLDFLKFGAWTVQIPRKKGDKVWIGFSEATISEETSLERFSLNEPYIIGSCENGYENNSEDIILSGAGTRIEIKGDGSMVITTGANKMTINSNIEVNGDMTINGNTTQIGDTSQKGKINVVGSVTASGDVQGLGKSLATHTHTYMPGDRKPTSTSSAD